MSARWNRIRVWDLQVAVQRRGIEWIYHPGTGRPFLKHRNGTVYDFVAAGRCYIHRRWDNLFN